MRTSGFLASSFLSLATIAAPFQRASAEVSFAGPFSDGAVLQSGMRVPVWGTAGGGEGVTVSFGDIEAHAKADASGAWRVDLPEMPPCREGRALVAVGDSGAAAVARDVLVGEVWFCSGQSNAEMPLAGAPPRFRDGKGSMRAQVTRKPLVRYCRLSDYRASAGPRRDFRSPPEWKAFTPENLGVAPSFSAMGVYFALELFSALEVPVGIVGAWWGGTTIEAWTPASGLASMPETAALADVPVVGSDEWTGSLPDGPARVQDQPRVLWNEMVAPWTPCAMRGFIWYQGCENVADGAAYAQKMQALYNGWSREFGNPALSMRFVQLAPWGDGRVPALQMAQAAFAAGEPHAAMAVASDIGNLSDIHPNDKETVGQRLAMLALEHDYGFAIESDSPVPARWRAEGGQFVVEFGNARSLYVYNADKSLDAGLELCGEDGEWRPARIVNLAGTGGAIEGARLVVEAAGVPAPRRLRYLHSRPWFGCIHNEANLPAGPFELAAE